VAKRKEYKKSFFIEMNMQNPPKPSSMNWYVRKADEHSIAEYTVCGYEFTVEKKEDTFGITEGSSPVLNFRKAFIPEEGHYWLSRDFSGQELRIMANLSGEQTWIKAFLNGDDIHKATAVAIWGEENYTKEMRRAAKAINFGLLYGTGANSLSEQLNVSTKEAQTYIDTFFEKLPDIKRFLMQCEIEAAKDKQISNLYGRKRRLVSYIDAYGLMNSGKRKSYNFPIQSMGAEVTKLALIKIYSKLINNDKYKGLIYFMNTIHDEINLSVHKDYIHKVAFEMGNLMLHTISGMPVPIITGLEIGNSMGLTWKFKQDEKTLELIPEYDQLD
jgi:DNA polymerase I